MSIAGSTSVSMLRIDRKPSSSIVMQNVATEYGRRSAILTSHIACLLAAAYGSRPVASSRSSSACRSSFSASAAVMSALSDAVCASMTSMFVDRPAR